MEGRDGEAESRVVRAGFWAALSRLREGETARRAVREWMLTAVWLLGGVHKDGVFVVHTALLDLRCLCHCVLVSGCRYRVPVV